MELFALIIGDHNYASPQSLIQSFWEGVLKINIHVQARTQTFKKGGSKFLIKMDFRYKTGTKLLDFRYKTGEGGGKISSHRDSHRGLSLHL